MNINKDLSKRELYFHPNDFYDAIETYHAVLLLSSDGDNFDYKDKHGRILRTAFVHPTLRGLEGGPGFFYVATQEEADTLIKDSL